MISCFLLIFKMKTAAGGGKYDVHGRGEGERKEAEQDGVGVVTGLLTGR